MKKNNRDPFTGKMFGRLLAPALISSVGLAISDMADAIVVGQRMGATGLAAISLSLPVYMIINVFMHGFGLGGSVKYSRYMGEGKEKSACRNFNVILRTALFISLLLAILGNVFLTPLLAVLGTNPSDGAIFKASQDYVRIIVGGMPAFFAAYIINYYLRNDGKQKLAGFGFTVGNFLDIGLNILFVLVFDFGAAGAAWSTIIGQIVAVLIYLTALVKKENVLKLYFIKLPENKEEDEKESNFDLKEAFGCFRVGFSTSVQYVFQMIFLLIVNNVLMNLAGENGVAIFDMLQNVSYLILYLYDGTAKAMQPLISTYCGEHNEEGRKYTLRLGLLCGSICGMAAIIFVCIFPELMCNVFGLTQETLVSMGCSAIRIYSIGAFVGGISILLECYYQACELEKNALVIATLRGVAVQIPCAAVFSLMGIQWFWWLFPINEIISLVFFFVWKKFKGEKQDVYDKEKVYSCTIQNRDEDLGTLVGDVEQFCEKWDASIKQTYFVTMTVEEICLAIMKSGFSKKGDGYIQITLVVLPEKTFELHIRDSARAFNPFSLNTNKASQEEDYDMDAMGMLVIKQKAKTFFYRQYQGYNSLVVKI